MTLRVPLLAATAALALAGSFFATPATAIQCDGPYQIVQGRPLSTPYCRDSYLAYVANRFYGMRVSAQAVRWNPSVKQRVCRTIGHDIRVQEACVGYRPDEGRRRWLP